MEKIKSYNDLVEHTNIETIFDINNLSFSYGYKNKSKQLSDISMSIKRGFWTTIIGPNGSGKSTFAKILVKILNRYDGQIKLSNEDLKDFSSKNFAKKVAYIPQIIDVPQGIKVYDFIAFGRNPYLNFLGNLGKEDKAKIDEAMLKTNTLDLKEKFMDEISGGQRQKVLVAMAYAQDTEIVILDEPTTYLDIKNQYELLELMHKMHLDGKTIITILHDINQAIQYSDIIYAFKDGKIAVWGLPKDVITEKNIFDIFGLSVNLQTFGNRKYLTNIKMQSPK